MFKSIKLKFTGISPLLLSCDKLADPLNPATIAHKELTGKTKKTFADHLAIARSQWEGLMYWDDQKNIVIMPTINIRSCIVQGAKLNKLGMQIKRGTMILDAFVPLEYGKKLTKDELWENEYIDKRSVVVSGSRVIAYRPKFPEGWSITFDFSYDDNTLDVNQIMQACENAGNFIGIGGFRPEKGGPFGRFSCELLS